MRVVIGAPIFNEEDGIQDFLRQIDEAAKAILVDNSSLKIEVLFVNDGSIDKTATQIEGFKPNHLSAIRLCHFSRNYGHTAAVAALIQQADGDALILMDADLQDDPLVLSKLIREWKSGAKSVRVRRKKRAEGQVFSFFSKAFYWLYGKLSGLESHLGIFGLYDRKVYEALRQFPELVRYHPGLLSLVGFKTVFVDVDRLPRAHGESRVGLFKLIKLANQAIFSFSTMPVVIVTIIGILISLGTFVAGLIVVGVRLFSELAIPGWASILAVQLFLTGLVIFSLGVIGQYIAIIVEEVKRRPRYIIESESKFEFR